MKKILIVLSAALFCLSSCKEDGLPANATVAFPITALTITVQNMDCQAIPKMNEDLTINDTMNLAVRRPSETGVIKQLDMAPGYTTTFSAGDEVTFNEKNELPIVVSGNGEQKTYYVLMNYQGPPVLYITHSGVKDGEGNGNYVDPATAMKLTSAKYNDDYEGYVDIHNAVWGNVVIVTADLKKHSDTAGGGSDPLMSFTLEMVDQPEANGNYFYAGGPWGNWTSDHGNTAITDPYGVWKLNFNTTSLLLTMQHTLWAIDGTATGNQKMAMVFDPATRLWEITATLSAGAFKFTTIPFTADDPAIVYGMDTGNDLITGGASIEVPQAGSYTIGLDIFNPPYYTYSIKNN